jgi:hypothetical protein
MVGVWVIWGISTVRYFRALSAEGATGGASFSSNIKLFQVPGLMMDISKLNIPCVCVCVCACVSE